MNKFEDKIKNLRASPAFISEELIERFINLLVEDDIKFIIYNQEMSYLSDLMRCGCRGYDNYSPAEIIEEVYCRLDSETDWSDEDIKIYFDELRCNDLFHKIING